MRLNVYFQELYYRLLINLFAILCNFIVLYCYKEQLIYLMGQHQSNPFPYFISTGLTEIFFNLLKLSFFLALYFSYPITLLQSFFFLSPALYKYEYYIVHTIVQLSLSLFGLTTIITQKYFIPYCWKFFNSFEQKVEENLVSIHLETRISDYLGFFLSIFINLNIIVHLFLIFLFLLKKVNFDNIIKYRKIIYFIFFWFATILSPPDIINQITIGIFFIIIFELFLYTIFLAKEYEKGE